MDPISLTWNNHNSSLINSLDHFKAVDSFVDVTLVCEGHTVKAHKMVLSAGSNVLRRLLLSNPANHPIIILAETKYDTLRMIIDFLYKGTIDIPRNDLNKVLQVATTFEIKDLKKLCEESLNNQKMDSELNSSLSLKSPDLSESSPKRKRQRRWSSDSDILIEATVLKREINFSPCRSEQSEVYPLTGTLSASAQTEFVEFHPQIAYTRSLPNTSIELSPRSDLTGACIQQIQMDVSTECDIQPLQEALKSNCVPIRPSRDIVKPRYNVMTDSLLNMTPIASASQLASDCGAADSSEIPSQDFANQTLLVNRLLLSIEKLQTEMMEVNKKSDAVLSKCTRQDYPMVFPEPLPPGVLLPIDCDEDLIDLNNKLLDTQLQTTLINHLRAEGTGKSMRGFLSSIIKKLLSQKVAMLYSRLGRKGKKSFMELEQVLKAILSAASLKFPKASKEELSENFGKALARASDWEGRNDSFLEQNEKNNIELR